MRKLCVCLSVVALAVGILLIGSAANPIQAGDAAMVANQQECMIFMSGNSYQGSGIEVLTPSGNWQFTCNASLTVGSDVDKTEHTQGSCFGSLGDGTGKFVANPGGQAHASCHGKAH